MKEEQRCKYQSSGQIIFLNCSYADSKEVKRLGAHWHSGWKMWFIKSCYDQSKFERWFFNNGQ
jgi:hypothetical protein